MIHFVVFTQYKFNSKYITIYDYYNTQRIFFNILAIHKVCPLK